MITTRGQTMSSIVLAFGAVFAVNAQAPIGAKTQVGIVFEMPDTRYTEKFQDEAIPLLKQAVTAGVARALAKNVRFLDFNGNAASDYVLRIRLDRAEGSPARNSAEFGFHLTLTGNQVPEDVSHYIVFRTKDQYLLSLGNEDALAREIEDTFSRADHRELVRRVLRHVAIADAGKFHHQPFGWIIYRDRIASCMGRNSRLEISNAFPAFGQTVHETFEARVLEIDVPNAAIVSMADETVRPEMIQQLRAVNPDDVRVERVFTLEYQRYCPPQTVPASAVTFPAAENPQ